MTTQEKYLMAIAARPSNEELKYWATLDTRAVEVQKSAFDADFEERCERFNRWFDEYKKQRVCRSNGIDFMEWKNQFEENIKLMSSLNVEDISINQILAYYEEDKQAGVAALVYVREYEPKIPEVEMIEQEQVKKLIADMDEADQLHRARIEAVRCGLIL